MDSFWSKLLILGIVAAIGLFFIHNVYTPQRSAQEAMADSTQQSVNAVKAGVDETAASIMDSDAVVNIIENNCKTANEVTYTVQNSGTSYSFKKDLISIGGTTTAAAAVVSHRFYLRQGSVESGTITFVLQ